jgi:hypothetical protein
MLLKVLLIKPWLSYIKKYNASNITIRTPNGNFTFIPPDRKRRYILIQDQVKLINIFTYTYFKQEN